MRVELLGVTVADLPLIDHWLRADHVSRYWGDPQENSRLLRVPTQGTKQAIVVADDRKVGLVLWQHPTRQELDEAGLYDVPEDVIDIDIMIGEPDAIGKGVGPAAMRLVVDEALADPAVPYIIAATMIENRVSLRALSKVDFVVDREFNDPLWGRCVLLVRHRSKETD